MVWYEMVRYEICSCEAIDNILYLTMYLIRYQWKRTAYNLAIRYGHIEIANLLLDGGADVNSIDKVSFMIWYIAGIVCVIECVM